MITGALSSFLPFELTAYMWFLTRAETIQLMSPTVLGRSPASNHLSSSTLYTWKKTPIEQIGLGYTHYAWMTVLSWLSLSKFWVPNKSWPVTTGTKHTWMYEYSYFVREGREWGYMQSTKFYPKIGGLQSTNTTKRENISIYKLQTLR